MCKKPWRRRRLQWPLTRRSNPVFSKWWGRRLRRVLLGVRVQAGPQVVAVGPARQEDLRVGVAENLRRAGRPEVAVGEPLRRADRLAKEVYSLVIEAPDVHNTYQMDRWGGL